MKTTSLRLAQTLFPNYVWKMPSEENAVYLTFDDGPHPEITPKVLSILKEHNAKASFFCVGENAKKYPEVMAQIIAEGHSVGNHTQHHLKGWKTHSKVYIEDIKECSKYVDSKLFRPPYGKLTKKQGKLILEQGYQIIMWDVLSYDYSSKYSPEKCFNHVKRSLKPGSIIVFHDSEKAAEKMLYALPKVLELLKLPELKAKAI